MEGCILIRDFAKCLEKRIGEKKIFSLLRERGYLGKRKNIDYNTPTKKSLELNLFIIRESVINYNGRIIETKKTPLLTKEGQIFFRNYFNNQ